VANFLLGALQEPENLAREEVGPGIHRYVSLPSHDNDTGVRQRFGHGLCGLLEDSRALAPNQQQRWYPKIPEPIRIEPIGFLRSRFPRDRVRRVHPRLPRRQ
jgi:hypothetical protein